MSFWDTGLRFVSRPAEKPYVPKTWIADGIRRSIEDHTLEPGARFVTEEDYLKMEKACEDVAAAYLKHNYKAGRKEGFWIGIGTVFGISALIAFLMTMGGCAMIGKAYDDVHAVRKAIEAVPGVKEAVDAAFPEAAAIRVGLDITYYTVKAGENLWTISKHELGDAQLWPTLMGPESDVGDPDNIQPGDQVTVNHALSDADKARARRFAKAYATGQDIPDEFVAGPQPTPTPAPTGTPVPAAMVIPGLETRAIDVDSATSFLWITFVDDPTAMPVMLTETVGADQTVLAAKVTDSASTVAQRVRGAKFNEPYYLLMLVK